MNIHLCVVTGQPLANLIPLLQEQPECVALAVSEDMDETAKRFINTLIHAGWSVDKILRYDSVPSRDYDSILMRAMEIEELLRSAFPQGLVTFNATGGNKLMALAFMSVFSEQPHRVIYTDTLAHRIEILYPRNQGYVDLAPVLTMELYLKASGKTFRSRQDQDAVWRERVIKRRAATYHLAHHADELQALVSKFNKHFSEFNNTRTLPEPFRLEYLSHAVWKKAMELMVEGDVLDQLSGKECWYAKSSDTARYLSGAWLEEYVWHEALRCKADDVAVSLVFTDDSARKENIRNEIDLAVLAHNRLLLLECKTGNIAQEGKDADIIYKLDSLTEQAGGLMSEGALISFKSLEYSNRDGQKVNTRARAGSVRLHTCEGSQLKTVHLHIESWIKSGKW
ncbi:Card1-like endonuclease domain-containing protein [Nitrincola tibetensis]|uniref:Card1-like endonuclease domain-containing protein n=1 Tax=Nitrincola tibetensis TaxID=2219697 RepID=UPI00139049A5|nr:DUF1887 family CARF protein [Nitrincola tibetensis]